MPVVNAVIGANYGDEGKGRTVDFLASKDSLIVRYNGGAQAGHTVVTKDGRRHVFHHVGAGAFKEAHTFLSSHFLVNPVVFIEEHRKLMHLLLGEKPAIFVDPTARVTTPWDMIVNQALERSREENRHGSCGLGIHETVRRTPHAPLYVMDLLSTTTLYDRLNAVRDYTKERLRELKLNIPNVLTDERVFDHFLEDINYFLSNVLVETWGSKFASKYPHIIFEGAQGLRLDANAPGYPHVTCSKTGLPNICALMHEAELNEPVHTYYVTRPYITRHGAGPLRREVDYLPYPNIVDQTNIQNEFQGSLRFAWFDMEDFCDELYMDITEGIREGVQILPHLALTCVDHLGDDGMVTWFEKNTQTSARYEALCKRVVELAKLRQAFIFGDPKNRDAR